MPKIFRPKDIEQMKASDVSQDFADYFERLSEERKQEFIESRPDLYTALLALKNVEAIEDNEERKEVSLMDALAVEDKLPEKDQDVVDDQDYGDLSTIIHNTYEHIDIPTFIKDDFRPVEALMIDDKCTKCQVHRIPLVEYNPKFHKPSGSILGMYFYHCPECNRLFIKKSRYDINSQRLKEWNVPFTFYDYELTKRYLSTQTKPYALSEGEKIYVPEQWVEENPKCPIHSCALDELPCVLRYDNRSIEFDAYYCDECKKVILRRTHALNLEDQCAEIGIPLVEFEPLVKKAPPKPSIPKREVKPDYLMNEGKRAQYTFERIADCYKLTENDTVVVSDSLYCTLDGHNTETILGLIWVKERTSGSRKSYLFMLGYCSECQKYYMDETDYKTVYKIGRLEVTVLLDVADDSYMITSGEVFDLENKHLNKLEEDITCEEEVIQSQPDYVNPYATMTGYDDGNLAYSKAVSKKKYGPRLGELYEYKERPYQYRVDITADGKTEVYYVGASDINLDHRTQVISANSKFGRELVHYQTMKVKKDGLEYSIKLSRQFDINHATLYGYTNLRTDEDIIFRRGITDPFLVRVLNMRKRQHNLIDIFVTIQENQNTIVDAPFEKNLIVQGCAGSGKTMVLLHRLSSLKYNQPYFDFSQDALILTPNDQFTLHIKGLAESLQIGSVNRASVEQYYQNVLEEYSKELRPSGAISSEMSVRQVFVDYIYSNAFRTSFEKTYSQIIALRNSIIEGLQILIELMGEKPRNIDVSDDSRVIPQIRTVIDWLKSKIDAAERKVTETQTALKEALDRKERLSIEIPQKREKAATVLRESAQRAKTKALAVLIEKQRTIDEKKNQLSALNHERESLEKIIDSSDEDDNPLLPEFLSKNADWIDPDIRVRIDSLMSAYSERKERETRKNYLEAVLSAPYETVIASQSSDDSDIARLLADLSNYNRSLEQLMQNKDKIEHGWVFGRSRRISDINKQIDDVEKAVEERKAAIIDVLNNRQTELVQVSVNIEQMNSEIFSMSKDIREAVLQNKKAWLTILGRQITMQSNSIENEQSLLNANADTVYQLSDEMETNEILNWLDRICVIAPDANDERNHYSRLQKEIVQSEETYSSMDEKIALAQESFENAQKNRYSEDIKKAALDIQADIAKYSALDTYQLIFDATVKPFKEEHRIKAISGRYHRYDLYAQLLFAMKFYGRKPKQIKFMCVDEGQDLAQNEYRLIYELNDYNVIFNIFGDVNQLIKTNRGISDWTEIKRVFHADEYTLNENYRNTNQITRFCNDSFEMSMLQTGVDGARVREITKKEFEQELSELQITTERVAVLLPRGVQKRKYFSPELLSSNTQRIMGEEIASGKIAVMYVDEVKGIEFDKVYVIPNKMGRNEKYIAYTRALSELIVVNDEAVPQYDDSSISADIV